jgi:hypothetical protein
VPHTSGCKSRPSKSKSCYDVRSAGQSALVSSTHSGPKTTFILLSDNCGFVHVGRPLWREDGSVVYNCCWASPAQSFSDLSSTEFMTMFYCLRFETPPPPWRARSPYLCLPETGWHSYTPRHSAPFSSPRTTRRVAVVVFEPASTQANLPSKSSMGKGYWSVGRGYRCWGPGRTNKNNDDGV